ncbi:MAG: HlyD family secretion protein [Methylocystis sp.]|uniref:HlyD family secretion protein n=1 Tax=Methylocystis sp. TaxID=1911079 RepID=UPI003DA5117F
MSETEALENRPSGVVDRVGDRSPAKSTLRHAATVGIGVIAVITLGAAGYLYWDHASHFESTDDAFIDARQSSLTPKVTGYIVAVPVTDNQHVEAGAEIARIDPKDYRIAVDKAQAELASAQASVQNLEAQVAAQEAQISASQANVRQSSAALRFAQQEAARSQALAQRGTGTVQREQQASSALQQEQARRKGATETVEAARAKVGALEAQRASAEADVARARAQLDRARLDLSYTSVTAAEPGRVVRLTAAVGQLAQTGSSLAMFVPDRIWVTANYKETQLTSMRPGQPADIRIDAYPDVPVKGTLVSIQPGSGTAFSLLPAENATGNYVKIVQRVPVKIALREVPPLTLGPGMSVVPTIRVNPSPSLYEQLMERL